MRDWNGLATGVGSMPHADAVSALRLIGEHCPECRHWPQLPALSPRENMYIQYSEGLPGVQVDEAAGRVTFTVDDNLFTVLGGFYEQYLAHDLAPFAVTPASAAGLHALLRDTASPVPLLKGQTLGPISFGLTVTDQNKRAAFYHDQLKDAIIKALALKAEWQAVELKKHAETALVFIDEPYLASFGSAYIALTREDVVGALNEVAAAIAAGGAIAGVHCCGNTDWSTLMETQISILNFDAYGFAGNLALYPEKVSAFLDRGGALAWGIVPTSAAIETETTDTLAARLHVELVKLEKLGLDGNRLRARSILTPSCGTGSLTLAQAERVYALLGGLARAFRDGKC